MNRLKDEIRRFAMPFADHTDSRALAANTAETFTIPAGAGYVFLSATEDFYARVNGTATVPTDITNGSASALNPALRAVKPADTISVISAATCIVTAEYFA